MSAYLAKLKKLENEKILTMHPIANPQNPQKHLLNLLRVRVWRHIVKIFSDNDS